LISFAAASEQPAPLDSIADRLPVAISRDDIFRKALALAPSDRAELVGLLIDSLDENVEQGVEAAWLKEIDRRAQELESGAVRSIPWELVRERFVRAPRR
jgi:putative addiction module component (TIGR02574 family)